MSVFFELIFAVVDRVCGKGRTGSSEKEAGGAADELLLWSLVDDFFSAEEEAEGEGRRGAAESPAFRVTTKGFFELSAEAEFLGECSLAFGDFVSLL